MAKYKVGDKVRILDVDAILFGRAFWRDGDITEVIDVNGDSVSLYGNDGIREEGLRITPSEMHAIEKVSDDEETHHELIERIELLETQVAENSRLLDEYLSKQSQPNPVNMYEWKDGRLRILPESSYKTANEFRKEAIAKAKKFVEDTEKLALSIPDQIGNYKLRTYSTHVEYVINEDKRTVVALGRGRRSKALLAKGIAKCSSDDVFNTDIGKAIAIGRAYGLDTSDFEMAPQPDEVVPGMTVEVLLTNGKPTGNLREVSEISYDGYPEFTKGFHATHYRIISDTEAQY